MGEQLDLGVALQESPKVVENGTVPLDGVGAVVGLGVGLVLGQELCDRFLGLFWGWVVPELPFLELYDDVAQCELGNLL